MLNDWLSHCKDKLAAMSLTAKLIVLSFALVALVLIAGYSKNQNHFFLATERAQDNDQPKLVVKAGKPTSSFFHWLPSNQHFGSVLAESGLREDVFAEDFWSEFKSGKQGGNLKDNNYAVSIFNGLRPTIKQLLRYAFSENTSTLDSAWAQINTNSLQEVSFFFKWLTPIAYGNKSELSIYKEVLRSQDPQLLRAALDFGIHLALEKNSLFVDAITSAYESTNPDIQNVALSAVSDLPSNKSVALFKKSDNVDTNETIRIAKESTNYIARGKANKAIRSAGQQKTTELLYSDPELAISLINPILLSTSADKSDKRWAIELLSSMAADENVPLEKALSGIIQNIDSTDASLAENSQMLLATVSPKDALEIVVANKIKTTTSKVANAKFIAKMAQSFPNNEAVVSKLKKALRDSNEKVRGHAIKGIGHTDLFDDSFFIEKLSEESQSIAQGAALGLVHHSVRNNTFRQHLDELLKLKSKDASKELISTHALKEAASYSADLVFDHLASAFSETKDIEVAKVAMDGICISAIKEHPDAIGYLVKELPRAKPVLQRKAFNCLRQAPHKLSRLAPTFINIPSAATFEERLVRLLNTQSRLDYNNADIQRVMVSLLHSSNSSIQLQAITSLKHLDENIAPELKEKIVSLYETGSVPAKTAILSVASNLGLVSVFEKASQDSSSYLKIFTLDKIMESQFPKESYLEAALNDKDSSVQTNALEHLAASDENFSSLNPYLVRAIANADPLISRLAMSAYVKTAEPSEVLTLLENDFQSPKKIRRLNATHVCLTLAPKEPAAVFEFLTASMSDSDVDIRRNAFVGAAMAMSQLHDANELGTKLKQSEIDSKLRMLLLGALIVKKESDAETTLKKLIKTGPPLAAFWSHLAIRLRERGLKALTFVSYFIS